MTVASNLWADISSLANVIYEESMLVAREQNIMGALITVFNDNNGMEDRKNAKYGEVTINQIGEADDLTSQAFTPSVDQTLSPYEYGAQFFISDTRRAADRWAVQQDATLELGKGMGSKVDVDLVGLFSSLTCGTVGGTSTDFTWAQYFAALTKLRAAYAPLPYVCVLHPHQFHCLGTAVAPGVTVTNAPTLQNEIVQRWFVGNAAGVDIYLDGNITDGTATTYGAMFSRNAIALDWRRAPRIEIERDASRRGFELNLSAIYAKGVWRPQYGVCINTAGTTPV